MSPRSIPVLPAAPTSPDASPNRRSVSSVIASAVVGVALGLVSVVGVASFSGQDTVPQGNAVPAEDALLGGPEYGTRG